MILRIAEMALRSLVRAEGCRIRMIIDYVWGRYAPLLENIFLLLVLWCAGSWQGRIDPFGRHGAKGWKQ